MKTSTDRPSTGPAGGAEVFPPELIAGIPNRDHRALTALFKTYFGRIYSLAYRILGDHTQAQDTTQDVFLKAYKGAPGFDVARQPWPWLVRITYNACRDHWRSWPHRLARQSAPLENERPLAGVSNPELDLLQGEDARRVQAAIMELPPESRAVVLLHAYQGLSHGEIAGIVGTKTEAVRKRYSRALARLAKLLEGQLGA